MTLLEKLLGSTLVSRRGETPTEEALADKTIVGLYFTASTCHPCQAFTPVLATVHRNMTLNAYKSLSMKDQLDVVVLSLDRSPLAFHDALLQTPFLAVPFRRREVVQDLWKRYEVKKIPTLVFVDANGDVVESEGRRFIENHYTDLRKIWEHLAPPLSSPSTPAKSALDQSSESNSEKMSIVDSFAETDSLSVRVALAIVVLCALFAWRQANAGIGSKRLRDFRLERVLKKTDTELTMLGNFLSDPQKKDAVLIIQTAAMDTSGLDALLNKLSLHEVLINDIYSTYQGDVPREIKPYTVNIIYPATEKHVLKHTDQNFHMVVETKETYWTITKPFIDSIPTESLEWVYNILDHKSETERIIYEDSDPRNGFVLLPDFKWSDPSNLGSLYCLAIVHDRSLQSLRDLTGSHLKLLRNIRASLEMLTAKFGVNASSLRLYIHYQPTCYHLHVHFSHVKMTHGTFAGKAVLLEDVIYNLSANSDHYKNATLSFVVGELQHKPLFELFRGNLIV
ncbi:hypothetical protein JM18_002021 [Phytophthora kernoviae]|uniref:m7GpppX diphosphatase n=2 Tax=Phytophthora kernoviae TaxID=325452 RepID=A0A8T0M2J1_9STRA|nr:hypothetical protein G195_004206 [Phytophthora kernoviae 00238/432]KAG2527135.1 hypothetical protein JM16_001919 [Phytophthora kernoviae]KAG2528568.1 hypothetical protein JM18_002021 [Phytophthora kernoviae]